MAKTMSDLDMTDLNMLSLNDDVETDLQYVEIPTLEQRLKAVSLNDDDIGRLFGSAARDDVIDLQFIDNPTFEQCLTAVSKSGNQIKFVQQQTPELCVAAVENDPMALLYVIDQSSEICRAAVVAKPDALQYVRNKTIELCLLAVQGGGSLAFVPERCRTQEVCRAAMITKYPNLALFDSTTGRAKPIADLTLLDEQSEELCMFAVIGAGPEILGHVRDQTPAICAVAVRSSPKMAMIHVRQQTPELCRLACSLDIGSLASVRSGRHRRYALRCLVADRALALAPLRLATSLLVEINLAAVIEKAYERPRLCCDTILAQDRALHGIELWAHNDYWQVVELAKKFHVHCA